MQKPLLKPCYASPKPGAGSFSIFFLAFVFLPFMGNTQDVYVSTAAGNITWTSYSPTGIDEVMLENNFNYHGDGFDGAMMADVTGAGISYTNDYHYSNTYGVVIQQIAITNNSGSPSSFTLNCYGNLGSDGSTTWHYSSGFNSYYTVSSDNNDPFADGGDPVISMYYGDGSLNAYTTDMLFYNGSDQTSFNLNNVPIAAGATMRILILCGVGDIDDDLSNMPDEANKAIQNLTNFSNWPADFTSFLSPAEKAEIMNWSAMGTLPLSWQSFTALKQNEKVLLNWSTANEQNTRDFTVQHSTDGTNWYAIGTVAAAGNSSTERKYSFTHATPVKGNNFYRIMQTDIDNRKTYSVIRKLLSGKPDASITVLGNPVTNDQLVLLVNEAQTISLLTTDGKLVWQKQCTAGMQSLDVSSLPSGIYILKSAGAGSGTRVVINQ